MERFEILNLKEYKQQAIHFNDLKYRCYVFNPAWDCYQFVELEGSFVLMQKANLKVNK